MRIFTRVLYSILVLGMTPFLHTKVDFFESMGWHLPKNIESINRIFFANHEVAQNSLRRIHLLKNLYDKNHFSQDSTHKPHRIPKKIHQIWVGPNKPPAIFAESQRSIQHLHPDWEYKLWTDADVPAFQLHNEGLYNSSVNYGEKADILRYEILYRIGGIYLDIDFVCLKPLDVLLQYDLCASIQPLDCDADLANGIIGSAPWNPILEDCILRLKDTWHDFHPLSVLDKSGPRHFQKSFMKFAAHETMNIIAFPKSYFYPIDLEDRLIGLVNHNGQNNLRIESLIRPESFAVHYWAGSWWKIAENDELIK
ncbi:hypothetical protein H0X06_01655 [Candidatus Dependentiae bacterium]|nr:hypothetical protein [Candidatus Dependentiae bacterium]